jgi:Histidine kinase-, DNA gyrase B-, and HSP90-like ATPase
MGPPFKFATVDQVLIDSVATGLETGKSTVILGALGSGKFLLRNRVRGVLEKNNTGPIVEINLQNDPLLVQEGAVQQLFTDAAIAAGAEPVEPDESLLRSFDGFNTCVYLLLANVDSLSHHLVRRLLAELRVRATQPEDKGKIVALLAGEYDLRDFVHGPASEVTNFASMYYVLQGCSFECYEEFLRSYFPYTCFPFPDEPSRRALFVSTGGNADLTIMVVEAALGSCQRKGIPASSIRFDEKLLNDTIENGARYRLPDVRLLRHALRLVPLEPEVWESLHKLVRDETAALKTPVMAPAALTLSGLAKRSDGRLQFSCPIIANAAKRLFDEKFFGDLYAQSGQWEKAFECYRWVDRAERERPIHGGDRRPTTSVIRAAEFTMAQKASDGPEAVRLFFARVCVYVFGFPEVSFYQLGNRWEPIPPLDFSELWGSATVVPEMTLSSYDQAAPLNESSSLPDELPVPLDWNGSAFAWQLENSPRGRRTAVFVGDFHQVRLVSPQREKLLRRLVQAFVGAHRQATKTERRRWRREFRSIQNDIISEVMTKLGVDKFDVEQALKMSANNFRRLRYRRLGFTLVDPTGRKVERLVDSENLAGIDFKSWQVNNPTSSVHTSVIKDKKALCVTDAAEHPLADRETVVHLGISAFAVIPILSGEAASPGTVAVGTIYVERDDLVVPSTDEVEHFGSFGRILYSLMEHVQRFVLLQKSLDMTPEPHIIVDARERLRYANSPAARVLGVSSGWRRQDTNIKDTQEERERLSPLTEDIGSALNGSTVSRPGVRFEACPEFKGYLKAAPIMDCPDRTIAALVHIEDLTYVDRVLIALDIVAKATDQTAALKAVLEATKVLGHDWARIYLIDPEDPDLLVSHLQFGREDEGTRFESREFQFRKGDKDAEHAWSCIEQGVAIPFCYTGNKQLFRASNGLVLHGTDHPGPRPFEKPQGTVWVMAPLIAGRTKLGSISLGCCKEELLPEHFHFLKVFFTLVATLLNLHVLREEARETTAKLSLALISHNLATSVAGFSPLIALYEDLDLGSHAELNALNRTFRSEFDDILSVLVRATEVFRNAPLATDRVDLFTLLESAIETVIVDSPHSHIVQGNGPLEVEVDPVQLKSALKEIVLNSIDFADKDSLAVEVQPYSTNGSEWIRIVISDSGIGVPDDLKRRIFDDFFTHRPEQKPRTGLGLALTRRVVELHGGRVYEDGKPEQGACFKIEIPRFRRNHPAVGG